jgi:hypothetical protein
VALNESGLKDSLDPYFAVILDVFYNGDIPEPDSRRRSYGDKLSAFETYGGKDRFLIDDIPVHVEYKPMEMVNERIKIATEKLEYLWHIKDSGTYGLYRLCYAEVLFNRTGWIEDIRAKLQKLPIRFWNEVTASCRSKMEHYLADLGAALYQNDNFFFLVSSTGFIKFACMTLLALNRRFEPSHRLYYETVVKLPVLPSGFAAQFETFLSPANEVTMERKHQVAQLIAQGVSSICKV